MQPYRLLKASSLARYTSHRYMMSRACAFRQR
eukprot:SAG31_NODE_12880_length_909_cov_1.479012_2_plen_31_part_01